ncbi:lactoylglutathione lyase [Clostridium aceticum]|uniref:Lactoylglutathione lyase n=1 Tax=Clostridium aceticum TaxID=84022 RepID=A0A0D8I6D9_9CLOT|nr:VOC family protein [Clostridium aceticum]AKL96996.1 lactoylglutathione lyase [Clostridium aceticum]KJF25629.1 hypothetical protein TZ02_17550 [Clostridium aceticum]
MEKFLFSKIGYIYLPVKNIDKSVEWYESNLGMKVKIPKFKDDLDTYVVVLSIEYGIPLLLFETNDKNHGHFLRHGQSFQRFAINCRDIDYTHKTLKNKGVEVTDIIVRGEGQAKYFLFKDIDKNLIEAAWSIWDDDMA